MAPRDTHEREVEDYDAEREMAFKRISERFNTSHRKRKEMLKWHREHPSPRTAQEQLRNLKRAIWN